MKIAVLGSGNGAHAVAFDWAKEGHDVYMYDFPQFDKSISAIKAATLAELERVLPRDAAAAVYEYFAQADEGKEI